MIDGADIVPVEAVISVGSNVDDAAVIVAEAIRRLGEMFSQFRSSSIYSSPAINGRDSDYVNGVVVGLTNTEIDLLTAQLKAIEREMGRTREDSEQGRVALDLDIVVWAGNVIRPTDFSRAYFTRGYRELML